MNDLPALVDAWLTGFAVARAVPLRRGPGVVEIELDAESRRLERVLVQPTSDTLARAARGLVGTSGVWLTTITRAPSAVVPPDGVVVHLADERLMTTTLPARAARHPQTGPVEVRPDGERALARVLRDGAQCAEGCVAVPDGGHVAVFDRIATDPAHRRQGHGAAVMNALGDWAREQGATTGVLVASAEGERLYASLGWITVGHVAIWCAAARPAG